MDWPEYTFTSTQWIGREEYTVTCHVSMFNKVVEGDGHRHGQYKLAVDVDGWTSFNGRYVMQRVRPLPFSGESWMRIVDTLPPRSGQQWLWHPTQGWEPSPIGALNWVEDTVLSWAFGMDELLDDIHIGPTD